MHTKVWSLIERWVSNSATFCVRLRRQRDDGKAKQFVAGVNRFADESEPIIYAFSRQTQKTSAHESA
jgi:hypothetical protein